MVFFRLMGKKCRGAGIANALLPASAAIEQSSIDSVGFAGILFFFLSICFAVEFQKHGA
jgi:hypothetical protein